MADAVPKAQLPLIDGDKSLAQVTREVCAPMVRRPGLAWWAAFLVSALALSVGALAIAYQITTGIGVWGENNSVGWAFDITNFVFWIGIGHAGTLISAILFLLRQRWRTSVNRAAEAMTLFAVMCAGIFPIIPPDARGSPIGCCRTRTSADRSGSISDHRWRGTRLPFRRTF